LIDVVHSNLSTDTIHSQIGQVHHESVALELCPVAQRVRRNAHSRSTMVTFVRPGGYLRSQHGWKTVSAGKIAFKIRTLKLNCLLLFSSSEWPVTEKKAVLSRDRPIHPINPVDRLMGKDHFSVELREGYLVLLINTGSGINEFATDDIWRGNGRRSSWFVADGRAHQVEIQLTNGTVIVRLDGQMQNMSPKKQPRYMACNIRLMVDEMVGFRYTVLNLNGHLYIGGLSEELRTSAPPQVWSARLREDFVGCLGDLFVDGMLLDLELETTAYWAKGYAQVGESTLTSPDGACSTLQKACFPGECLRMSWVEPVCDCTNTNYAGTNCKQESHVLTFNGYQGIRVQLSLLPQQSEAESLILRFQTSQQDALLFESSSATSTAPDRFSVQILNGRIVVFYNLGAETRSGERIKYANIPKHFGN
uniref:LAM_G_DOMAIN domain-containing protein n=1 Tax=Mesocestoides corti TaxID=53468 RepID=A0A0R3UFE0_MESCO